MTTIRFEIFKDRGRDAVLKALDAYLRELTGHPNALGARDADLPELFHALDAHLMKLAKRFNDPDSPEPGSVDLKIIFDAN